MFKSIETNILTYTCIVQTTALRVHHGKLLLQHYAEENKAFVFETSGGSRNLSTGGRGPVEVYIVFEVWRLLWCPFTHTLCFCSDSREKNTHCKYNKVYACYWVKIFKITPIKKFKQGFARPARQRWIRLWKQHIQRRGAYSATNAKTRTYSANKRKNKKVPFFAFVSK